IEVGMKFTEEELKSKFAAAGSAYLKKTPGILKETANSARQVLESKVNRMGTNDVKVNLISDLSGVSRYVRVELAGVSIAEAQKILEHQGLFEIRIETSNGETEHVLYGADVEHVRPASQQVQRDGWGVGFTLSKTGAIAFQQAAISTGATKDPLAHKINMYLDNRGIYSAPLSQDLASSLQEAPAYEMSAMIGDGGDKGKDQAKELEIHLRAGALPVEVKIAGSGSVSAELGDYFKFICIIAAIAALIAVSILVYVRYRVRSIVLPMILTNISEVVILLGIAVFIQQLDIAAIAALIAVLGTGIDQLVIITDEVVHEGAVFGRLLFLKRLKRALTIILTSAATVIIAMLPLILMDLSTLKGFAIVNILGILIGVLITRPAYGKIIMEIMANKKANE
ncbi:MAG TPA: preprotein translocase subunit SecD, partial [Methanocorpusculum sp.]|nr:preprotein translocase subunit SecD [Methanocorpusculum sp.]